MLPTVRQIDNSDTSYRQIILKFLTVRQIIPILPTASKTDNSDTSHSQTDRNSETLRSDRDHSDTSQSQTDR